MKTEQQLDGTWLSEQRLRNGKYLLAEGSSREEAAKGCRALIRQNATNLPISEVEELSFNEDDFQRIFGK